MHLRRLVPVLLTALVVTATACQPPKEAPPPDPGSGTPPLPAGAFVAQYEVTAPPTHVPRVRFAAPATVAVQSGGTVGHDLGWGTWTGARPPWCRRCSSTGSS